VCPQGKELLSKPGVTVGCLKYGDCR
jgi:hypothetical protein